VEELTKTERL